MKEKRRDSKGRILHTGESQRTDGKYLYKYVDALGKTKYVYAWRLTPIGKKMTLCQLYAKQNTQRVNVKKSIQKQREQLSGNRYMHIFAQRICKNMIFFLCKDKLKCLHGRTMS